MAQHPGSVWLQKNWNDATLPNNEWVAATASGVVAHDPSLDNVIQSLRDTAYTVDDVIFAFVSFDVWQ